MTRLLTFLLLFTSLLGLLQQREIVCVDLDHESLAASFHNLAEKHLNNEAPDHDGEDCGCTASDCQDCAQCHRLSGTLAHALLIPISGSSPAIQSILSHNATSNSFTRSLLDPPRIS